MTEINEQISNHLQLRQSKDAIKGQTCCCGNTEFLEIYYGNKEFWRKSWPDLRTDFKILECTQCGLKKTSPAPYESEMETSLYIKGIQNRSQQSKVERERNRKLVAGYSESLLMRVPVKERTGNLLDIGCGDGTLVRIATSMGWKAFGFDLDLTRIEEGHKNGISNLVCGSLSAISQRNDRVTCIVLRHVLEHIAEPDLFLSTIWRILRPGGIVLFEVPNYESLTAALLRSNPRFPWVDMSPLEHVWQMDVCGIRSIFQSSAAPFRVETLSCRQNLIHGSGSWKGFFLDLGLRPFALINRGDRLVGIARKIPA